MDKYLTACYHNDIAKENREIHPIGCAAYCLASKYEDVYYLPSKTVAEKMGQGSVSASEIIEKEKEMLRLFGF